jgi:hypothetical protein
MNNTVLTDGTVMYYALKVNGQIVSRPVSNPSLLEAQKELLPENQRFAAQIVTVTASGQELLLG